MFGGNKSDCVSGWEENNQFHRQNEAAWIFYSLQSKDVENIWETKDKQLVSDSSVIITWSCPLTVKKVSRSWWNFSSSAFLPMYLSTCMFVMEMIKRWSMFVPFEMHHQFGCTVGNRTPASQAFHLLSPEQSFHRQMMINWSSTTPDFYSLDFFVFLDLQSPHTSECPPIVNIWIMFLKKIPIFTLRSSTQGLL